MIYIGGCMGYMMGSMGGRGRVGKKEILVLAGREVMLANINHQ